MGCSIGQLFKGLFHLGKTLVFTPNITTLFGLKEIGPIRPFDNDTDFTMVHPDDVAKVKALLSTIGDNSDEIDDFVIRFKDKNEIIVGCDGWAV